MILISFAMLGVGFLMAGADAEEPVDHSPPLPGSHGTMEKAIARADVIATGVLVKLGGGPTFRQPGLLDYDDAEFKITKLLKGKCENPVALTLWVVTYPVREEVKVGVDYVIFFTGPADPVFPLFVGKMMPADRETVSKVTAAIKVASENAGVPAPSKP